ncbi:MAG: AAA family ATPase [Bacteroidales bacterium]
MKILAIRIENIASLEGLHTIDFTSEPLASASLFAITGATGSGKSTILDAITIALYTNTPRVKSASSNVKLKDGIQQSDVRNLLRRGSGNGYAEVDFVALNGLTYRSRCTIKRARNKATGTFQPISLQVIELKSGRELQGTLIQLREQLVELIGLTYEQFTRTVLLAQGEFANFLRAGDNEKSDLLMKLTGSEQFNKISMEIYNRSTELTRQLKDLENRVDHLEILNPDELQELEQSLLSITFIDKELKGKLEKANDQLKWWSEQTSLDKLHESSLSKLKHHSQLIEQSQSKRQLLDLSQRLAPLRQIRSDITQLHLQILSAEQTISELSISIERIGSQIDEAKLKQVEAKSKLEKEQQLQSDQEPLVESARKIDNTIQTLSTSLEKLDSSLKQLNAESSELSQQLTTQQEQEKGLKEAIEIILDWFDKNSSFSSLVPNAVLLDQSITKYYKDHQALSQLKSQISSTRTKSEEIDKTLSHQLEEDKEIEQQIKLKSDQLTQLRATQLGSHEELQSEYQEVEKEIELLQTARERIKRVEEAQKEIERISNIITKEKLSLKDKEEEISQIDVKLPLLKSQLESDTALFEQADRTISTSVASLRSTLKLHTPCPVCGSEDHPYANYLEDELVLLASELRSKQLESQEKYNQTLNSRERSIIEIDRSKEQIESNTQELIKQRSIQDNERELYHQSPIGGYSEEVLPTVDQLDASIKHGLNAKTSINERINKVIKHNKEIERVSNSIREQEQSRNKQKESIEARRNKLNELKRIESRDQALYDNLRSELAILYKQLNEQLQPHFEYEVWGDTSFLERLRSVATQWNINKKQQEDHDKELQEVKLRIATIETKHKGVVYQIIESKKEYDKVKHDYDTQTAQRNALLDGLSVIDYLKINKRKIELLERGLSDANDIYTQLDKQLSQQMGSHKQAQDQHKELLHKSNETQSLFNEWIVSYNSKHSDQLTLEVIENTLITPLEEIEKIREYIDDLDKELTVLTTQERLHRESIKKHSAPELVPELSVQDITLLKSSLITDQEALQKRHNELNHKLFTHNDNLTKRADVQKNIDAIKPLSDRWSNLNSLFGSAQGDAFRKIAMGFTLDYLLEYANIDLQRINQRYQLERIDDTLQLMVVDRYMCDDRRSAASLSGGETFIVSLSLALGLSSLTSEKMQIETLFIDEGFGALDPDTLRMAMEALNTLHSQGRKVGVISHVQEMTEQIATRIELIPLGGGSSRLEIR